MTQILARALLVLLLLPSAAFASTNLDAFAQDWNISELRFGVLKHDVKLLDITQHRQENGVDLNGEVAFNSPRILRFIGSPRPNVGFTANTNGDTSHMYVGLTYDYTFDCGLFVAFNGGFAVHTGLLDNPPLDENHELEKRLGTRVLFHGAPEIGYRFANGYGMSLYWEHLSNGQVLGSDTNQGLDNVGVRLSYRFKPNS